VGSGAIAAPSANKFGHVSPTTAEHVREEFGEDLCLIDGGGCEVGLESTILDLSRGAPVLLRPGGVTRDDIAAVSARCRAIATPTLRAARGHSPRTTRRAPRLPCSALSTSKWRSLGARASAVLAIGEATRERKRGLMD
jgi:L-threonylcarbamoyladenylate synthase